MTMRVAPSQSVRGFTYRDQLLPPLAVQYTSCRPHRYPSDGFANSTWSTHGPMMSPLLPHEPESNVETSPFGTGSLRHDRPPFAVAISAGQSVAVPEAHRPSPRAQPCCASVK